MHWTLNIRGCTPPWSKARTWLYSILGQDHSILLLRKYEAAAVLALGGQRSQGFQQDWQVGSLLHGCFVDETHNTSTGLSSNIWHPRCVPFHVSPFCLPWPQNQHYFGSKVLSPPHPRSLAGLYNSRLGFDGLAFDSRGFQRPCSWLTSQSMAANFYRTNYGFKALLFRLFCQLVAQHT